MFRQNEYVEYKMQVKMTNEKINGNNIDWYLLKDKPGSIITRPLFDWLSILERIEHIKTSKRLFNDHKDDNNSDHEKLENTIQRISFGNLSNVVIILSEK
jgi:hypothetical protein